MMTAASIAASSAQGYAEYLESRTAVPEQGTTTWAPTAPPRSRRGDG